MGGGGVGGWGGEGEGADWAMRGSAACTQKNRRSFCAIWDELLWSFILETSSSYL